MYRIGPTLTGRSDTVFVRGIDDPYPPAFRRLGPTAVPVSLNDGVDFMP